MLKKLSNIVFAIALLPVIHNPETGLQEHTQNFEQYRCEIISYYTNLRTATEAFGDVLLSEDYEEIFRASISVTGSLDEIKRELESVDVPGDMLDAYNALLGSVDSYREGADLIRIAMGTLLGKYERKGADIQELIDQSLRRVTMANEYLGQSIALHGRLFESYAHGPDECKKVVAGNY